MRRSVLMIMLVIRSGRVGLTMMWTRRFAPLPLSVSPISSAPCRRPRRAPCQRGSRPLQHDRGDLARRGVDLIEGAPPRRVDLHGVEETRAHRLHPRRGVGLVNASCRLGRLRRRAPRLEPCSWPGSGRGLGSRPPAPGGAAQEPASPGRDRCRRRSRAASSGAAGERCCGEE